jgi:hypothetical protein
MSSIFAGRFTAQMEGKFVVFIIGMRINRRSAIADAVTDLSDLDLDTRACAPKS